jgi:YggT family protein
MVLLGQLLLFAIDIFTFLIIASVIISWLLAFNVMNMSHPATQKLVGLISRAVDPVLNTVRRFIPAIGGIDISPIIVIFALMYLKRVVFTIFIKGAYI